MACLFCADTLLLRAQADDPDPATMTRLASLYSELLKEEYIISPTGGGPREVAWVLHPASGGARSPPVPTLSTPSPPPLAPVPPQTEHSLPPAPAPSSAPLAQQVSLPSLGLASRTQRSQASLARPTRGAGPTPRAWPTRCTRLPLARFHPPPHASPRGSRTRTRIARSRTRTPIAHTHAHCAQWTY